jgi:hypothetical protein
MQMAAFEYDDALLLFEVRGLVEDKARGNVPRNVSNEYYTTDGIIREGVFYRHGGSEGEPIRRPEVHVTPGGTFGSFVQAVRTRNPQDNNADAEVAHYSAALCHLANISFRLGRPMPFDSAAGSLGDNKQVVDMFNNLRDNLRAVDADLAETMYQVGPKLAFDAQTEQFTGEGASQANVLLSRPYRQPYVVPQQV